LTIARARDRNKNHSSARVIITGNLRCIFLHARGNCCSERPPGFGSATLRHTSPRLASIDHPRPHPSSPLDSNRQPRRRVGIGHNCPPAASETATLTRLHLPGLDPQKELDCLPDLIAIAPPPRSITRALLESPSHDLDLGLKTAAPTKEARGLSSVMEPNMVDRKIGR